MLHKRGGSGPKKATYAYDTSPVLSRRNFMFLAAGAAVTTAAIKLLPDSSVEPEPSPKEQTPHHYLTEGEAKELYLDLKRQVEEKQEEAKLAGKPLRIFILEGHGSTNGFAYKLMLVDIAKRLGIGTVLQEASQDTYKMFESPEEEGKYKLPDPETDKQFRAVYKAARRAGLEVRGMDNLWPEATEYAEETRSRLAKFLAEEIKKEYQVTDYNVEITSTPDEQFLDNIKMNISGKFTPPVEFYPGSPDSLKFRGFIDEARMRTYDTMREERNEEIIKVIKDTGSALIITGKNHGEALLGQLRDEGHIDLTFSPSDKVREDIYLGRRDVSPKQKDALRWANNPENAIQQEGKDFPSKGLPVFIGNVIEKANNIGTRGR